VFETAIARAYRQDLVKIPVEQMSQVQYSLRRRLTRLAGIVYCDSLLIDSGRISLSTKARRYAELVYFLLDEAMLR
jgi:hypothetical protein